MVSILGVSMLIAWGMSAGGSAGTETGRDIIEQIQRDGLARHWRGPLEQWRLISVDGKPRGWTVALRRKLPDGGFEGLDIIFTGSPAAGTGAWEHWKLNAHATEGSYHSAQILTLRGQWSSTPDAAITLSDARVLVAQPKFGRSEADAPENYIPEGAVELACYLTARDGRRGRFTAVFNSDRPSDGRVRFGQIVVDDIVASDDGWQATVRRMGASGITESTLFFDNRGRVVRRQSGQAIHLPAAVKEVAAAFPSAGNVVRRVLSESKFPRGPGITARGDGDDEPERPGP